VTGDATSGVGTYTFEGSSAVLRATSASDGTAGIGCVSDSVLVPSGGPYHVDWEVGMHVPVETPFSLSYPPLNVVPSAGETFTSYSLPIPFGDVAFGPWDCSMGEGENGVVVNGELSFTLSSAQGVSTDSLGDMVYRVNGHGHAVCSRPGGSGSVTIDLAFD
jgi:hypothetical protein